MYQRKEKYDTWVLKLPNTFFGKLRGDPVKEKFKNDNEANLLTTRSMKKEWRV